LPSAWLGCRQQACINHGWTTAKLTATLSCDKPQALSQRQRWQSCVQARGAEAAGTADGMLDAGAARRHGGVDSAPTDGPNSHRPAGQPTSWRRRRGRGGRPTGRPTDSPAVQRRRRVPLGPLATRVKLWSTRPGETWRTSRAFRIFRSAGGDATATNRLTAPPTQLPAVQHELNDPLDPGVA
jgi:hypothetical protein